MHRYDFHFRQNVAESELDEAFAGAEDALFNVIKDTGLIGVAANAVVTEHTPNDLTVDVSGSAVIYDKDKCLGCRKDQLSTFGTWAVYRYACR